MQNKIEIIEDNIIDIDLDAETTAFCPETSLVGDGLIMSLNNLGRVDIDYIANSCGRTKDDVIEELRGSIFQNPTRWNEDPYQGWETKEEYLSGNMFIKYMEAMEANAKFKPRFSQNVKAIQALMPERMNPENIFVTLGSPWLPPHIIEEFIDQLLFTSGTEVKHNKLTSSWTVRKNSNIWNIRAIGSYGTRKMDAYRIIQDTLNGREIVVMKKPSRPGEKATEIDQSETNLALDKQRIILEEFQKWVWLDDKRRHNLTDKYYRRFGCIRKRTFNGSFLQLPTMSKDVELYPYQKDAVARMILSPNTLLAHDVGAGKTYEMVAAGMELKRMGLSTKNLYAVPNGIINQWRTVFAKMYPNSNIKVIKPSDFTPAKRKQTLEDIRDNDCDAIVMAQSCFDMVTVSSGFEYDELVHERDALVRSLNGMNDTLTVKARIKALDKKIAALNKERAEKAQNPQPDNSIPFEELGITRLFVDEAHSYKNVPFETKMSSISGINPSGSEKCKRMFLKVKAVQKANNGGGVIFATGTPVTNSISDCYIMQRYLQRGELNLLGISNFDAWVMMFAEVRHEFEVEVDTTTYRIGTRFGKFHNLPELASLMGNIADFHKVEKAQDVPEFDGYSDVVIPKTAFFRSFLEEISRRADKVKNHKVKATQDNMLKITTDGRKGALDLRLVEGRKFQPYPESKVFECARKATSIYFDHQADKSTQLIFCDISTPRQGFNVYDELKELMVSFGVDESDIAFIHDYESEKSRATLFDLVNKGEVRIVIGSTPKLGTGVNVQERLVAIHHLDVPWRPSDMVQREGRIIRPGNTNPKVEIYRYILENSFDAYSWQLLESKQTFISKLLSCDLSERSASDIDDSVLNYAEVKALAIGNPLIKERVEAYNTLQRYKILNCKLAEERDNLKLKIHSCKERLPILEERLEKAQKDLKFLNENTKQPSIDEKKAIRQRLFDRLQKNLEKNVEACIGTYRGFEIWSPASHTDKSTYIHLKREGVYSIEASNSPIGMLTRIDNYLDRFDRYVDSIESDRDKTLNIIADSKQELRRKTGYSEEIQHWQIRLAVLDKRLGVSTNQQ